MKKRPNASDATSVTNTSAPAPDSAKLLSLLALAAGAAAMPQSSKADIVYTDISASPAQVGFGTGFSSDYAITNLPGGAQIGFKTNVVVTAHTSARLVTIFQQAGYARFKTLSHFALPTSAGKAWGQILGNVANIARIGVATYSGHYPGSYDHLYLPFTFRDAGNNLLYGWMQVSLDNPRNAGDPNFTLWGWAYQTDGTQIQMGQVGAPEPSSVAMMVLGALTLGAAGVRNWRRNKTPKAE